MNEPLFFLRNDWRELETAIDLAYASRAILRSSLEDILSDFDFSQVKAYITSTHDSSYKMEQCYKKSHWELHQYLGFYVASRNKQTYELIVKNSYKYKIISQVDDQKKTIAYNLYSKAPTLLEIIQFFSVIQIYQKLFIVLILLNKQKEEKFTLEQ